MIKEKCPTICFGFAVLNEERDLPRCLESIRSQKYPQYKVEIILADGGSTDRTIQIAQNFDCIVIDNPLVRAEPGAVLAHNKSKADIKVFFAADNVLPEPNWISNMVKPFIKREDVYVTYTHISVPFDDNSLNKYYSHLHVEPFSWFIYGYKCNPKYFSRTYNITHREDSFTIFDFSTKLHPLLAMAQGFCVRGNFDREAYNHEDDIIPVIEMIDEGKAMAYVPSSGIYHYHLTGLADFIKKYNWRIMNSLTKTNVGFSNRAIYQSRWQNWRKYSWLIYGYSIVLPLIQGIYWSLKIRQWYPLWHSPICLLLCLMITINVLRVNLGLYNK